MLDFESMPPAIATTLAALACAIAASSALGAELRGTILRVEDGDTVTLLAQRREVRLRLDSIDAPELAQPFGKQSRKALAALCAGKQARVTQLNEDPVRGRIGRLRCGRVDASTHQVRSGMAWVYVRYADPQSPLYRLEYEARLKRQGLWSDAHAVAPWDWRQRKTASKNW
jgi:endonuclease YncB( thermonuclease family)